MVYVYIILRCVLSKITFENISQSITFSHDVPNREILNQLNELGGCFRFVCSTLRFVQFSWEIPTSPNQLSNFKLCNVSPGSF